MRKRCDKTKPFAGFSNRYITRRPRGLIVAVNQSKAFGQIRAHLRQRQILIHPVFITNIAHWHDFDNCHIKTLRAGPTDHIGKVMFIHALQRHGIQLNRQPGLFSSFQPGQNIIQIAPTGDAAEPVRIKCVYRNIEALNTRINQFIGHFMQLAAICGDCQLFKIARFNLGTKIADQLHDIAPHQRLAPGQANFARSHRHKFTAHLFKLFKRQKFRFWQECHFFCHAIYTAKITAISH